MSEDLREAFRTAPGFEEHSESDFELRNLDFDGAVTVVDGSITLEQELPTLDGAVLGETVAAVVEEGWLDTFRRRVADVTDATDHQIGEPTVDVVDETVRVRTPIRDWIDSPEAARHAANYVEARWIEGIVPGYEYVPRVQAIRDRAHSTGQS